MYINCFAHDPEKGCQILYDMSGCGNNCPFRKSTAERRADIAKANSRLTSLPEVQQWYIADTCYGGRRPWRRISRKAVGQ